MAIHQEGTAAPVAEEVKKTEEIVRKIVIDVPGRHQEYHVGLKAEADGDVLRMDLGNEEI
ncbi:MAG: hypothetical protein II631_03775 [Treponema sp.]|nr:hypothetical protein [Treponema sp.]